MLIASLLGRGARQQSRARQRAVLGWSVFMKDFEAYASRRLNRIPDIRSLTRAALLRSGGRIMM